MQAFNDRVQHAQVIYNQEWKYDVGVFNIREHARPIKAKPRTQNIGDCILDKNGFTFWYRQKTIAITIIVVVLLIIDGKLFVPVLNSDIIVQLSAPYV